MQLRKTKRTYGCEINIAPLIDVVFLLIIFFMTVSQISRVEVEDLVLPEAAAGQPRPPVRRLIVNVHATGRRVVSGQDQSMASLVRMLADAVNEPGGRELSVLVRADREADWAHVAEVMQACAANGIGRVRVAVSEPGAGPL